MCKTKGKRTIHSIIYLFLIMTIVSCGLKKEEQPVDQVEPEEKDCVYEYGICVDSLEVIHYEIGQGQYLASILGNLGFTPAEGGKIIEAISPFYPPSRLQVGNSYATITGPGQDVRYMVFEKSRTDYTVVDLTADTIKVYEYIKPVTLKREYAEGTINSCMWNAIIETGAPAMLALKLSDVYAWQIDFFDVKKDDSFRLMYDVAYIDDTTMIGISSIEGAVFTHQGKSYYAIPFQQDSVREFFDEEGNSLRKAFLKAPLDFIRITSKFSNSRYHPILKRHRPHHGVDYAAPVGTPVKTIGDGMVVEKGFQGGGAGNFLKIKHNSSYTTTYMHLSRFAKGIEKGRHVKQGEVIAYVGSTGLSTGPHLDFRVHKNNQPINPVTIESPPCEPVRSEWMDSFRVVQERMLLQLDSLQMGQLIVAEQAPDSLTLKSPHS
ncbi:M23 family metallopeptidase [Proteiniphilum sp.]|uniref:M23 family metallopeptidase n=1 Tax=Proteiniphilum sp. TaxID=1926877 RepID=UPI002B1EA08B|nr:peptidoglycan DD-metalloendopeptidase family protein [Proteiniphilum sp.]MEA4916508.1 peptidoglycan DD-metalloendopeptidase family protein [Proteiniphilum sp.]